MVLKHSFTYPSPEVKKEISDGLVNDIRAVMAEGDTELKSLVNEFVEGFFDIIKMFYEDLEQLDNRIAEIEKKYELDKCTDEMKEEDDNEH